LLFFRGLGLLFGWLFALSWRLLGNFLRIKLLGNDIDGSSDHDDEGVERELVVGVNSGEFIHQEEHESTTGCCWSVGFRCLIDGDFGYLGDFDLDVDLG
jgi:hypothetical protein